MEFTVAVEYKDFSFQNFMDLGQKLYNEKKYIEAVKLYKIAAIMYGEKLESYNLAALYIRLANAYYSMDDKDKSTFYYEKYLELFPQGQASVFTRLAHAYYYIDSDKSIDYHNKALNIEVSKYDIACKLFAMTKSSYYSQQDIKETAEFEIELLKNSLYKNIKICDHSAKKQKKDEKLNIGYLSSDCHAHTMMNYILPIWENHNKEEFNFVIFNGSEKDDSTTEKIRKTGIKMVSCVNKTDAEIASLIYDENIDILIDISGFTHMKAFCAFYKPAPVMISYLGYLNTMGIKEFDYILTDRYTIPEKYAYLYTEKPLYLDTGYQIFAEKNVPEIEDSPFEKNGYITYGSFNCTSKLSDASIFIWAQILHKDESSKLLIYRTQLTRNIIKNLKSKFKNYGISADRLIFENKPYSPHFRAYSLCDISLDPYPFNGMSIAIETALMGVPTITLVGEGMQSRGAGRINSLVGLDCLNAASGEEYIAAALNLGADKEKLKQLRSTLRSKVNNSDLRLSAEDFTKDLESKYKKVWQDFINSP